MDTVSKPEHTEEFTERPNNILTIWKRLWPLIISVGLFVLVGIVWNQPVVYDDHGCDNRGLSTFYIGLIACGTTAGFIINWLLSVPGTMNNRPVWIQDVIRIALIVVGIGVANNIQHYVVP